MASAASEAQWSWPADMGQEPETAGEAAPFSPPSSSTPTSRHTTDPKDSRPPEPSASEREGSAPRRRQYYPPRTCRICLEEVQPTTEIDDTIAGRVFGARARVRYVSDDPELGRLISPCKCKGSQRYVHEGCLQAWRRSQPMSARHFWQCPTCLFQYRMERLRWSQWVSSKLLRVALTILILVFAVFLLGFIADPIINFCVDPWGSMFYTIFSDEDEDYRDYLPVLDEDTSSWGFHFMKGLASLGLLGFLKSVSLFSPWRWFSVRTGGGRRRTGRDRVEDISWIVIIVGVMTVLAAIWKLVNHYTSVVLEKASNRVVDIQADDNDDDDLEEEDGPTNGAVPEEPPQQPSQAQESRKDR
ncbi:E3 ubiquitin-protein ligase MARCH9 [Naviculisporaceae sp. PSN 640]